MSVLLTSLELYQELFKSFHFTLKGISQSCQRQEFLLMTWAMPLFIHLLTQENLPLSLFWVYCSALASGFHLVLLPVLVLTMDGCQNHHSWLALSHTQSLSWTLPLPHLQECQPHLVMCTRKPLCFIFRWFLFLRNISLCYSKIIFL